MKDTNTELLPLTNDFVFKRVFTKDGNDNLLKDLLSAILNMDIEILEIKNPELLKDSKNSKLEILDIKAKINKDTLVNIEMQVQDKKDIDKRSLAYVAKMYSDQLVVGGAYKELCKTISINILNFNFFNRNTYHSVSRLKFEDIEKEKYVDMGYLEEDEYLSENIEMHYIELPKFRKRNPGVGTKLEQWLWLICGEEEKVKMAKRENEEVKKAAEIQEMLSQDEEEKAHYISRLFAQMDMNSALGYAKEEGMAEGLEKGIEQGEKKKNLENAKKMLKEGIELEMIVKITGLSKEEIMG